MVAVFIFNINHTIKKEFSWKKAFTKILTIDDDEIIKNKYIYFIHHVDNDEIDNLTDEKLFEYINNKYNYNITLPIKKSKKGYISNNKDTYVRVIRGNKKWFKDNYDI